MKFFEVGEGGGMLALAEPSAKSSACSGRVKVGDSARPAAGSSGSIVSVAGGGGRRGRAAEHQLQSGGLLHAAL